MPSYTSRTQIGHRLPRLLTLVLLTLSLCQCGTPSSTPSSTPSIVSTPVLSPQQPPTPTAILPSKDWQTRWLRGIPCRAPCWEGITPGTTTASEASTILEQSPALKNVEKVAYGNHGYITWDWITGENGGEAGYEANTEAQTITFIHSYYHTQFRLRDIIAVYGEPSHVDATGRYFSGVEYFLLLYYQPQGFSVSVNGGDQQPELSADLLVDGPDFFDPNNTQIITGHTTLPWQGMQSFDFYCRDMEQDQDCRVYEELNKLDKIVATALIPNDGAAPTTVPEKTTVDIRGFYWTGFEVNAFQACKTTQAWWVESELGDLATKYHAVADYEYQPVYVHVKGIKSTAGSYGHLNQYPHEFQITEVIEVRSPQAGDCE